MNNEDDIQLPEPQDIKEILEDDGKYDPLEITDNDELKDTSPLLLKLDFSVEKIEDADFNHLTLHNLEKALLKSELADSNMYLKNIHKGFKFARTTRSLIALVGAGLAVHKHRREVIKDIKESKKDPLEIDEYGNVKAG